MDDIDLDYSDPPQVVNGHGGARPGAGRPKKGTIKSPAVKDFESARARNEASKADLNELEFKIKSGEYVSRAAVRDASATIQQSFIQTLRSVRDNLERKGVPASVCEQVHEVIEDALAGLGSEFELMCDTIQ